MFYIKSCIFKTNVFSFLVFVGENATRILLAIEVRVTSGGLRPLPGVQALARGAHTRPDRVLAGSANTLQGVLAGTLSLWMVLRTVAKCSTLEAQWERRKIKWRVSQSPPDVHRLFAHAHNSIVLASA